MLWLVLTLSNLSLNLISLPWVVTNDIRANPVIPCGLGYMGLNEDVRDLNRGNCDAPNSDKYVCLLSPTSGNYWVELGFINNCKEPQL